MLAFRRLTSNTRAADRQTLLAPLVLPAGRCVALGAQMLGVFSEFERSIIVERVNAGLRRARASGTTLGRPRLGSGDDKAGAKKIDGIKAALARGDRSILKIAADFGVGSSTVQRVKREIAAAPG